MGQARWPGRRCGAGPGWACLMVAFALATTNRRLALAFDARRPADAPAKRRRGRPYTHSLTRHTLGEADKDKVLYVART
jgi:hypothetical protein